MKSDVIIFKEGDVELRIGDVITLSQPIDDEGFLNSSIGEKFEAGVLDKLDIKVCQREWLEVYFVATATIGGVDVTEEEFYGDEGFGSEVWDEHVNYHFLRYVLSKGAIKT